MVFEESDPDSGKVIQWLGDLPMGKTYLTEHGNKIERISDYEVKFDSTQRLKKKETPIYPPFASTTSTAAKRIPFPVTKPRSRQLKVLAAVPSTWRKNLPTPFLAYTSPPFS